MPQHRRRALLVFMVLSLVPPAAHAALLWQHFPGELFSVLNSLVVRDYLNMWAGGVLAREGREMLLFAPDAYIGWLRSLFGERLDRHAWAYPPHLLLLAVPFSFLPLVTGFFVWAAAGAAFLAAVLRCLALGWMTILAVLASPAVLENAVAGQNGTLFAAALAGGLLASRERRPVLAGALLGLFTLKPQLALLVPACLLAARDWRTIGWSAAFAGLYIGTSLLAFGLEPWRGFLTVTMPFQSAVVAAPFGIAYHMQMPSPFISMRALGAGLGTAFAVQGLASITCLVLAWLAWRRRGSGTDERRLAVALVLMLAPLATPYSHSYDLVTVAVGVALLAPAALVTEGPGARAWRRALALAWIWPGIAFMLGAGICPGLGPLALAPAAAYATRRALAVATCPTGPAAPGAVEKSRTSTGLPPPAPQAGASTIPPRPQTG